MNKQEAKRIAILGSTGSIGTQALEVVRACPDMFDVVVLTAQNNADLLIAQAVEFQPSAVAIANEQLYDKVKSALEAFPIKVYSGNASIASMMSYEAFDLVLTAMVGYAGLLPTIEAIKAGRTIALANKETLVVAGELITELAKKHGVNILPVDSEHSAIFQCLVGEWHNPIEKIILTASGGPFRGKSVDDLLHVTKAQALKHPNWTMGAKITVDSASLMNKGLEVIEAKWLFGLHADQIEVVVHPQSVIHSMVQFFDGSIKAQMGLPDMKLPIQFALGYPERIENQFPRFDFARYPSLTFETPDTTTFRNLALAFKAMAQAGNMPCILNAANEVAVECFLSEQVGFLTMSDVIEACMDTVGHHRSPNLEVYIATDQEARAVARDIVEQLKRKK